MLFLVGWMAGVEGRVGRVVKFFSGWKGKQFLACQLKIKKLKRPYLQLFFSFLQMDHCSKIAWICLQNTSKIIKAELQKYGTRALLSLQRRGGGQDWWPLLPIQFII